MKRSNSRPSFLIQFIFGAIAAVALAYAPQAALAQHGGGGHGGGGHSGGGHVGGGGGSHAPASGGHSSGSPSGAAVRPGTPVSFGHGNPTIILHGVSPSSFARPTGPATGFAAGSSTSIPQHVTLGFPPLGPERVFPMLGSGAAGATGWRPGATIHGGNGAVLSFSGQGHEIWQDSPQDIASRSPEMQGPRPFPPRRFPPGPIRFGPGYGYGYGFGWGGFYPFGFGLGFGPVCDPFWDFGCDAFAYPGYWNGYYGPYGPGMYSSSGDNVEADASQDYALQNQPPDNSANAAVLYLNDGTSFAVTNYWVADYKLHYTTDGVRENVLDLDQIDVQRTVDENAARGVNFTLRPAPGSTR